MTPQQYIKLQNGQNGIVIPIFPSLVQAPHHQHCQDSLIHLADTSSHGVANRQTRSLSSRLHSINHGSSSKTNHRRIIHSSSNKTRMYESSLDSATSVDEQAAKCQSVDLSHNKLAEVISLKASLRNLLTGWNQA